MMPRNDSGPTRWTLYEHAGGRMWSTEQIDLWKRPVEVIAVDALLSDEAIGAMVLAAAAPVHDDGHTDTYYRGLMRAAIAATASPASSEEGR